MKYFFIPLFFLFLLIPETSRSYETIKLNDDMINNPVRYIGIYKWGFYVAARVAILHHIEIENKSSVAYKNIKIRVNYYSTTPGSYGMKVGFQDKVLNIVLPPNTREIYLREGLPIGAGSNQLLAKNLEVLSAEVAHDY